MGIELETDLISLTGGAKMDRPISLRLSVADCQRFVAKFLAPSVNRLLLFDGRITDLSVKYI
jgi:hypothetical protein